MKTSLIKTHFNDNKYRFSLSSLSGSTILNSIAYTDEDAMKNAIAQLHGMQVGRGNFERKTNHAGQFLFHLKDANGQLLGYSLPYGSEAGMENGIKNLTNSLNALKKTYDQ
ncbi:hypothetical protein SAMN05421766_102755 [Zobellia uliginosa]|uniref:DUF1508 domain-containing protein n=1 Tax=Zobellia uliginosa TaxID=143224 RepID=A0ABY1KP77_9FLAO|nr:YegP family protein [Zobellia uliginosa]SIS56456.1 hypothetical protein SAMN05421766_102755 [Zobellia uliginosa]